MGRLLTNVENDCCIEYPWSDNIFFLLLLTIFMDCIYPNRVIGGKGRVGWIVTFKNIFQILFCRVLRQYCKTSSGSSVGVILEPYMCQTIIFLINKPWPNRISLSYAKDMLNTYTQRSTSMYIYTCYSLQKKKIFSHFWKNYKDFSVKLFFRRRPLHTDNRTTVKHVNYLN